MKLFIYICFIAFSSSQQPLDQAKQLIFESRYYEAISLLETIEDPRARYYQGWCYYKRNQCRYANEQFLIFIDTYTGVDKIIWKEEARSNMLNCPTYPKIWPEGSHTEGVEPTNENNVSIYREEKESKELPNATIFREEKSVVDNRVAKIFLKNKKRSELDDVRIYREEKKDKIKISSLTNTYITCNGVAHENVWESRMRTAQEGNNGGRMGKELWTDKLLVTDYNSNRSTNTEHENIWESKLIAGPGGEDINYHLCNGVAHENIWESRMIAAPGATITNLASSDIGQHLTANGVSHENVWESRMITAPNEDSEINVLVCNGVAHENIWESRMRTAGGDPSDLDQPKGVAHENVWESRMRTAPNGSHEIINLVCNCNPKRSKDEMGETINCEIESSDDDTVVKPDDDEDEIKIASLHNTYLTCNGVAHENVWESRMRTAQGNKSQVSETNRIWSGITNGVAHENIWESKMIAAPNGQNVNYHICNGVAHENIWESKMTTMPGSTIINIDHANGGIKNGVAHENVWESRMRVAPSGESEVHVVICNGVAHENIWESRMRTAGGKSSDLDKPTGVSHENVWESRMRTAPNGSHEIINLVCNCNPKRSKDVMGGTINCEIESSDDDTVVKPDDDDDEIKISTLANKYITCNGVAHENIWESRMRTAQNDSNDEYSNLIWISDSNPKAKGVAHENIWESKMITAPNGENVNYHICNGVAHENIWESKMIASPGAEVIPMANGVAHENIWESKMRTANPNTSDLPTGVAHENIWESRMITAPNGEEEVHVVVCNGVAHENIWESRMRTAGGNPSDLDKPTGVAHENVWESRMRTAPNGGHEIINLVCNCNPKRSKDIMGGSINCEVESSDDDPVVKPDDDEKDDIVIWMVDTNGSNSKSNSSSIILKSLEESVVNWMIDPRGKKSKSAAMIETGSQDGQMLWSIDKSGERRNVIIEDNGNNPSVVNWMADRVGKKNGSIAFVPQDDESLVNWMVDRVGKKSGTLVFIPVDNPSLVDWMIDRVGKKSVKVIDAEDDAPVVNWMIDPVGKKSGSIIFVTTEASIPVILTTTDEVGEMKKVSFDDAFCTSYTEAMNSLSNDPMVENITISVESKDQKDILEGGEWEVDMASKKAKLMTKDGGLMSISTMDEVIKSLSNEPMVEHIIIFAQKIIKGTEPKDIDEDKDKRIRDKEIEDTNDDIDWSVANKQHHYRILFSIENNPDKLYLSLSPIGPVTSKEVNSGNYLYYIGFYTIKKKADLSLSRVKNSGFPNARIVEFNAGKLEEEHKNKIQESIQKPLTKKEVVSKPIKKIKKEKIEVVEKTKIEEVINSDVISYHILFRVLDNPFETFDDLKSIGPLYRETFDKKGNSRYLVGNTDDLDKAKLMLNKVIEAGYKASFIVEYKNGSLSKIIQL